MPFSHYYGLWKNIPRCLTQIQMGLAGRLRFLPTFYPQKSSILTEVMGEDKKTLTIFSSLTKILWSFFHKTASQGLLCCPLPLTRPLPQPPRHAPKNAKKAARFLLPQEQGLHSMPICVFCSAHNVGRWNIDLSLEKCGAGGYIVADRRSSIPNPAWCNTGYSFY